MIKVISHFRVLFIVPAQRDPLCSAGTLLKRDGRTDENSVRIRGISNGD